MDKINFVNNSSPYINATNLNQLQTNVETAIQANETAIQANETAIQANETAIQANETAIQDLQTLLEPTILYNNTNGSLSGISLSDNPSNYDYIEIVYSDTLNHFSTERIYDTTKKFELTSVGSSGGLMYIFNKVIEFTSNSINIDSYVFSYFSDNASPRVIGEDKIKIYKVIGYKEV